MLRSQFALSLPLINPNYFMSLVPLEDNQGAVLRMLPKPESGFAPNMLWEFYSYPSYDLVIILNDQGKREPPTTSGQGNREATPPQGKRYCVTLSALVHSGSEWRSPLPGDPTNQFFVWHLDQEDPYKNVYFNAFKIKSFGAGKCALVSHLDESEGLNLPSGDLTKDLIWWSGAGLENNSSWGIQLVRQFNGDPPQGLQPQFVQEAESAPNAPRSWPFR